MHRRHHREAVLAPQPCDQFERLLLVPDVERAGGLVEQQDRRLGHQRPRDHQPLLLAAAQLAEPAVAERREVELLERLADERPVEARLGAEVRRRTGHGPSSTYSNAGHVVREHRRLRHVRHERGAALPRPQLQRGAVDHDVAGERHDARARPQDRRLAGAVRPDQPEPAAGAHAEREAAHRLAPAVPHRRPRGTRSSSPRHRHRVAWRARSSRMKNGAPKNAVTTPIGSSAGAVSMRPGMSTRIRNAAPNAAASGSTRR